MTELLDSSDSLGEASYGGIGQRPWRRLHARAEEKSRGRESSRGREKEEGESRTEGGAALSSSRRSAAALIRRVDGQGVDSELLPWTEEDDEAVEVGLGQLGFGRESEGPSRKKEGREKKLGCQPDLV
jgi:hypothetical protein